MVKTVISISIFCVIIACLGPRQFKNDYTKLSELKMHCLIEPDTAILGDRIYITICYTNNTEELIKFIPNSIVLLSRSDPLVNYDYGKKSSIYLNKKIDEKTVILIPAHSDYCKEYTIEVNDSLFNTGRNEMLVQYIYKPLDLNTENVNGVLNGNIFSNNIVLFIK